MVSLKIGKTLFYDRITGGIIVDTGEWPNAKRKKTVEEQILTYPALAERNRDTFDYIELQFGQYTQDFEGCNSYRINPDTKQIEFSYPDPNAPEEPQPYQAPLSEQIASNMDYLLDVDFRLMMVELGMV